MIDWISIVRTSRKTLSDYVPRSHHFPHTTCRDKMVDMEDMINRPSTSKHTTSFFKFVRFISFKCCKIC